MYFYGYRSSMVSLYIQGIGYLNMIKSWNFSNIPLSQCLKHRSYQIMEIFKYPIFITFHYVQYVYSFITFHYVQYVYSFITFHYVQYAYLSRHSFIANL